ncbi:Hsp20 family protein [bacterium]|nr:Hsp20 family protein [bacterium]
MLVRRSFLPVSGGFDSSLDRLLRDAFETLPSDDTAVSAGLPVNVWEDENAYHLEAELPGFTEKDVEITVLGDELRIEAGKEETTEEKDPKGKLIRRERRTGKVARSLRFAVDLEESDVKAKFEHGLLTIDLPKAKAALPRRIQIR